MAMFMKLLAINMVANSLRGLSLSARILLSVFLPLDKRFISWGEREKYATSEADIRAEPISNRMSIPIQDMSVRTLASIKGEWRKFSRPGSGSNDSYLGYKYTL